MGPWEEILTCGFSSAGIALILKSCCFRCRLRGDLGADLGLDEKVKTGGDPFSSSAVRGGCSLEFMSQLTWPFWSLSRIFTCSLLKLSAKVLSFPDILRELSLCDLEIGSWLLSKSLSSETVSVVPEEPFKGASLLEERSMASLSSVLRDFELPRCLTLNGLLRVLPPEPVLGGRGCIVVCVASTSSCVLDDSECKLVASEKDLWYESLWVCLLLSRPLSGSKAGWNRSQQWNWTTAI